MSNKEPEQRYSSYSGTISHISYNAGRIPRRIALITGSRHQYCAMKDEG